MTVTAETPLMSDRSKPSRRHLLCTVCNLHPAMRMCRLCQRSYETTLGGDTWSVIEWAAKRTRRFAKRKSPADRDAGSPNATPPVVHLTRA